MAEKALSEKAKQDASRDKHLWPSIDRLVHENSEDVRQGRKPASPPGFQMGRAQSRNQAPFLSAPPRQVPIHC